MRRHCRRRVGMEPFPSLCSPGPKKAGSLTALPPQAAGEFSDEDDDFDEPGANNSLRKAATTLHPRHRTKPRAYLRARWWPGGSETDHYAVGHDEKAQLDEGQDAAGLAWGRTEATTRGPRSRHAPLPIVSHIVPMTRGRDAAFSDSVSSACERFPVFFTRSDPGNVRCVAQRRGGSRVI